MVSEGTIGHHLPGGDRSLQHHLAVAGHLQINGFARGKPDPFSGVDAGKQPFTQLHRYRGGCGHHQQRMHPDCHGNLKLFAHGGGLAQVAGPPAHTQPMHGHRVHRLPLKSIHPNVGNTGFGILGDHQAKGDHTAGISGPGPDQGDVVEIDLIAPEDLLPARRG
ncbi:MAG: Uncharacterised protein [Synechococcus sp. CC9902]|nr:MAG: Uncharacterised protein [Synechococcus sp. CC9902]